MSQKTTTNSGISKSSQACPPEHANKGEPDVELTYQTVNPNSETFSQEKIESWVLEQLKPAGVERILNPCAGPTELSVDSDTTVIRNDINPDHEADTHIDFRQLDQEFAAESFDGIVFDPPYTTNQSQETYGVDDAGFYEPEAKEALDTLLKPGGVFIQFGYTTTIMPPKKGCEMEKVTLFNTLGDQDDYIAAVSTKPESPPSERGGRAAPTQVTARSPTIAASESVRPNEGSGSLESEATADGNGNTAISVGYRKLALSDDISEAITQAVRSLTEPDGHQIHITPGSGHINATASQQPFGRESSTSCRVEHEALSEGTGNFEHSSEIATDPWNIDANFADGVADSVVLDVPHLAFQRNIRTPNSHPENTHLITAIKRSVCGLPTPNSGQVIQIGHTATVMSNFDYDYVREACIILNHPDEPRDYIITADRRPDSGISTVALGTGPVDAVAPPAASNSTQKDRCKVGDIGDTDGFECVHCGSAWYRHPAWYTSCEECGTAPNEYCVNHSGQNLPEPHDARIASAERKHDGRCAPDPDLSLPELRDTDPSPTSEETSLGEFV